MIKTKVVSVFIILCLLCLLLMGCSDAERIKENRFVEVERYNDNYIIFVDLHTGVKYFSAVDNSYKSGISPLYDENGQIEIMSKEELEKWRNLKYQK